MIATIHPCDTGELLICFSHGDVDLEMFVELPATVASCDPSRVVHVHEHSIVTPGDLLSLMRQMGFNPTGRADV